MNYSLSITHSNARKHIHTFEVRENLREWFLLDLLLKQVLLVEEEDN